MTDNRNRERSWNTTAQPWGLSVGEDVECGAVTTKARRLTEFLSPLAVARLRGLPTALWYRETITHPWSYVGRLPLKAAPRWACAGRLPAVIERGLRQASLGPAGDANLRALLLGEPD